MRGRILYGTVGLSLVLAFAGVSCDPGQRFPAEGVRTGTVALGNETALVVDTILHVEVSGNRRLDEIHYRAAFTVTASAADVAERIAETLEVTVSQDTGARKVTITFKPDTQATYDGKLTIEAPADLDLGVSAGGNLSVQGMEGDMDLAALGTAVVNTAEKSVRLRTNQAVEVHSSLLPTSVTDIQSSNGTIELIVPARISASIDSEVGPNGQILINHPQLPPWSGNRQPYIVTVNGGLATARVISTQGNVSIHAP